ncbi:hypothetical protein FRC10_009830 [Ceratobasidium sp. 414]|nr:hypothetical protein FRC10_009830 [Ceratobasidium sp. 414]
MSDGKTGEPSNQGASSSSQRPLGTLRAATQPTSRVIGNVLGRKPTDGAGSSRGKLMFMPNKVVRRKVEENLVQPPSNPRDEEEEQEGGTVGREMAVEEVEGVELPF